MTSLPNIPGSNKDKAIKSFWLRNYSYGQQNIKDRKLGVDEVYGLFQITSPNAQASVDEFHCISTRLGVKVKKGRSKKCYWATPLSDLAVT